MRKSLGVLVAALVAICAISTVAVAQTSATDDAARVASKAAKTAFKKISRDTLISKKRVHFKFYLGVLDKAKVCPPGNSNPIYCTTKPVGGSYRFLVRFKDQRPGMHHHFKVVSTFLKLNIAPDSDVEVTAHIRPIGIDILKADGDVTVQLISRVRATNSDQSAEVLASLVK